MKGIIFTEFLEMVEEKFGYVMVDEILIENDLPSGGVYTSIGTYDFSEMAMLVATLQQKSQIPMPTLLFTFGEYLFKTFVNNYGGFFERVDSGFEFLESIDNYIHVEVKKLYPDAELPHFKTRRVSDNQLEMIYRSERRLADLAEGLLTSSMKHFKADANITRELLDETGSEVKFVISI